MQHFVMFYNHFHYSSLPILFCFLVYPQLSKYVNALPYPPKCLSIVDHDHTSSDKYCSE